MDSAEKIFRMQIGRARARLARRVRGAMNVAASRINRRALLAVATIDRAASISRYAAQRQQEASRRRAFSAKYGAAIDRYGSVEAFENAFEAKAPGALLEFKLDLFNAMVDAGTDLPSVA